MRYVQLFINLITGNTKLLMIVSFASDFRLRSTDWKKIDPVGTLNTIQIFVSETSQSSINNSKFDISLSLVIIHCTAAYWSRRSHQQA